MRFVLFPLIALMLTAGIAMAQKSEKKTPRSEGFRKERVARIVSGRYSRMLLSMLQKARSLDLTDEQRENVQAIRKSYVNPIITEEKKSRKLQRTFMNQMQEPEFDSSVLKATARKIDKTNADIANKFIDGMTVLREAVGPKNYAKLTPVTKIDRSTLIKLKEQEMARARKQAAESDTQKTPDIKPDKSE